MTTLDDVIDFMNDSDDFHLTVVSSSSDARKIDFLDESGLSSDNDQFFIAGDESGPWILIHARSFEDAWEAWIDERPTIPESELPEAYGVPDSPEIEVWKDANPSPHYVSPEWKTWRDALHTEELRILKAWGEAADGDERPYPELIEGYEMQSNISGTGIVDVGHYSWMREADLSEITLVRKTDAEKATEKAEKEKAKAEKLALNKA